MAGLMAPAVSGGKLVPARTAAAIRGRQGKNSANGATGVAVLVMLDFAALFLALGAAALFQQLEEVWLQSFLPGQADIFAAPDHGSDRGTRRNQYL
jgi:hypothetical protein